MSEACWTRELDLEFVDGGTQFPKCHNIFFSPSHISKTERRANNSPSGFYYNVSTQGEPVQAAASLLKRHPAHITNLQSKSRHTTKQNSISAATTTFFVVVFFWLLIN